MGTIEPGWRKASYSNSNGCVEAASWRKARRSVGNGACVEAAEFRRSSFCASRECLEAGQCGHGIAVRDSQLGDSSPVLAFAAGSWQAFTAALKAA